MEQLENSWDTIDEMRKKIKNEKMQMSNEEIALRLVEAWGNQGGLPTKFDSFIINYQEALKELKEE